MKEAIENLYRRRQLPPFDSTSFSRECAPYLFCRFGSSWPQLLHFLSIMALESSDLARHFSLVEQLAVCLVVTYCSVVRLRLSVISQCSGMGACVFRPG